MPPSLLLFGLLAFLSFALSCCAAFDETSCARTRCKCFWSSGKRTADCKNAGYTTVPAELSPDIQALRLDGNPLGSLGQDAFKSAGLLNLQTLSLSHCNLRHINENAFRDLKIVTILDLAYNNLTELGPKTFDGNEGLKTLKLAGNPLKKLRMYQFPPLSSLQVIDLSDCHLEEVDGMAFRNLGGSVESVQLERNRLRSVHDGVFTSLINLRTVTLHGNPWVCDCRLKNFRDFIINKGLYNRPTACHEPSRLQEKTWDNILPAEFACKPEITTPFPYVFGAPGVDATLACKVLGSPAPQTRWVVKGRIVNNNTNPQPFAEQTYLLREEYIGPNGVEKWFNLTITNPTEEELGNYICVAENNGGVMEKAVRLTFDDPSNFEGGFGLTDDQRTIWIGIILAIAIVFLILLSICCYFCLCKPRRKKQKKKGVNRVPTTEMMRNGFDSQKLLPNSGSVVAITKNGSTSNPLPKPPRNDLRYDMLEQKNNGGSTSGSTSGSDIGVRPTTSASFIENEHYPDLLNTTLIRPPTSSPHSSLSAHDVNQLTTLNPGHLMLTPQQQIQYAHLMSPFQRSGTLPIHHVHRPRSISFDHSNSPIGIVQTAHGYHVAQLPLVHHHHHAHPTTSSSSTLPYHQTRPGYVTLPRRPRSSWSVPRDTPSPVSNREPIYDGIGPRTSADGSSRLNLNKKTPVMQQQQQQQQRYALPPYYAPIQEMQECPASPKLNKNKAPKSTPNISNLNNSASDLVTSSSEATLMEENISAYCEPFGTAEMPEKRKSVDLESTKSGESSHEVKKNPPPKTLPKPKVKPVPPPKPRKSFCQNSEEMDEQSSAPLITFQDECEDGSEV